MAEETLGARPLGANYGKGLFVKRRIRKGTADSRIVGQRDCDLDQSRHI